MTEVKITLAQFAETVRASISRDQQFARDFARRHNLFARMSESEKAIFEFMESLTGRLDAIDARLSALEQAQAAEPAPTTGSDPFLSATRDLS